MFVSTHSVRIELEPHVTVFEVKQEPSAYDVALNVDGRSSLSIGLTWAELGQLSDVIAIALSKHMMAERHQQVPGQLVLDAQL